MKLSPAFTKEAREASETRNEVLAEKRRARMLDIQENFAKLALYSCSVVELTQDANFDSIEDIADTLEYIIEDVDQLQSQVRYLDHIIWTGLDDQKLESTRTQTA